MGLRVSAIVLVLVCGSNQGFRCLSDLETGKAATQGAPFSGLVDYGDMLTGILSYFACDKRVRFAHALCSQALHGQPRYWYRLSEHACSIQSSNVGCVGLGWFRVGFRG